MYIFDSIDIDISIITSLRNDRTDIYIVSGVQSSGQEHKVFTIDGPDISGYNKNIKMTA